MLKESEILVCKNLLLRISYYNPIIYLRLAQKHLVKNQFQRPLTMQGTYLIPRGLDSGPGIQTPRLSLRT